MNCGKDVFNGEWIWYEPCSSVDSYGEFYSEFEAFNENCRILLSCDSDYALYVNGNFVTSNQYGDFEHYKIYDEIDLTSYLINGKNRIAIEVWHFGETSQKYLKSDAGLIFDIYCGDRLVLKSDESILSRKSRAYKSGLKKRVSSQLGFSFFYDSTKQDDWKNGNGVGFENAKKVFKDCIFYPRPNEKLRLLKQKEPVSLRKSHSNRTVLVDLGEETVGLPLMKFTSPVEQKITVFYGEYLFGENVQRFVGGNDYSFEYIASVGENVYFNPFLRFGCRYLQVYAEEEIDLEYLGVLPQTYPVQEKPFVSKNEQDRAIERLCVNTLKLCMLEHYVDCPWREQGLYAFDSRNQMLAGYYAFGNYRYAKSNLLLMSKDRREDGLLSITAPSGGDLAIPSFSLYYVLSVWEYLYYSGEKDLEDSIFQKLTSVLNTFSARIKNGLIHNFCGEKYWHFYDWSEDLNGYGENKRDGVADLILNCLYAIAFEKYVDICVRIGKSNEFSECGNIQKRIYQNFYNEQDGLFSMYHGEKIYTSLGNSLAILCGAVKGEKANEICEKMLREETSLSSLSTKVFFYDALLLTDREKYADTVLERIRKDYSYMLQQGATATWETLDGPNAFGGSSSLCHGWSAMPIYYFYILKDKL